MVSVRFFCLQHYNYRNPLHQIYCSRQGNKKTLRSKRRHTEHFRERDKKRAEKKRNLQSGGARGREVVRNDVDVGENAPAERQPMTSTYSSGRKI